MELREDTEKAYQKWLREAKKDPDLIPELASMSEEIKKDAFWRGLEFGTAGLRGVIGAGINRMNVYVVSRASRGLAAYLLAQGGNAVKSVAIGYDSRVKSELFAKTAAAVFAEAGIKAYIWPELMPVPTVSYAVRNLGCDAGVMITASHNPGKYNGYKVFGPDGCQLCTAGASAVLNEIEKLDYFDSFPSVSFEKGLENGMISYIPASVYDSYAACVKATSVLPAGEKIDRNVAIVYTPLNGAGLGPVTRVLGECGFTNVTVVPEQRLPDGNFTTCPFPNPEIREALACGLRCAESRGADLLLATDPDCDRVGIAVKDKKGEYTLLSGNQTGILLLDFICARLKEQGKMPKNPVCIKTVVTSDLARKVAEYYGVCCRDVLTGFKYIGEQLGLMEAENRIDSYLLGFEESYGYLSRGYVRDKDGVNASLLVCEMFAWYKTNGTGLCERLEEIYKRHGFCLNDLRSYYFEGADGFEKMGSIMRSLRAGISEIAGRKVLEVTDYSAGIDGLPATDMLRFKLEGDCILIVRPSGTEPKLKAYFTVYAPEKSSAEQVYSSLEAAVNGIMK